MIRLDDLLHAAGGTLHDAAQATEFTSFAFDSRQLEPGQLFLAVKTATRYYHLVGVQYEFIIYHV